MATSGSILAAAGCSTNGVNVVLWDTMAPPATCQASLFCHEGIAQVGISKTLTLSKPKCESLLLSGYKKSIMQGY